MKTGAYKDKDLQQFSERNNFSINDYEDLPENSTQMANLYEKQWIIKDTER